MFEAAATQELCDTLLHRHQELLFSGLRNHCVSVAVMFVQIPDILLLFSHIHLFVMNLNAMYQVATSSQLDQTLHTFI